MERSEGYNTKQRGAVLAYIASLGGGHVTAAQIVEHFGKENTPIGRATVYRLLEKLTDSGELRKYTVDGVSGACFQAARADKSCNEHFHLKCEDCGGLFHLQCDTLRKISRHIMNEHTFEINAMKTVLYGKCSQCRGE